ncbi:MAG: hypothetical protein RL329_3038 [Bacteroidota bacterium]
MWSDIYAYFNIQKDWITEIITKSKVGKKLMFKTKFGNMADVQ